MTIRRQDEEMADEGERPSQTDRSPGTTTSGDAKDRPVARDDNEVVEKQVVHSSAGGWSLARGWVRSLGAVILVALGAVETLLVFRLGFLLADANPANGFVNFIYDVSKPLASPFQGIISNSSSTGSYFEPAAFIAMLVYPIAALLLIAGLWAITSGPGAAGDKTVTSSSQHRERAVRR